MYEIFILTILWNKWINSKNSNLKKLAHVAHVVRVRAYTLVIDHHVRISDLLE